jgi:hypothetical protein
MASAPTAGSTPGCPRPVAWQVDVYWATCGWRRPGDDDRRPRRTRPLDSPEGWNGRRGDPNVALGEGEIDLTGSIAAGKRPALDRLIVEFDSCATDILEALERSRRFLAA